MINTFDVKAPHFLCRKHFFDVKALRTWIQMADDSFASSCFFSPFHPPNQSRRFDYTATADLAMSAAVYAVHAAQWAQRGALSAPGPRREFFSQLRRSPRSGGGWTSGFKAERM